MTHRQKVKAAFADLRKKGFFARMNFWCCSGCATSAMARDHGITEDSKFVFFHQQDAEAFQGGNLTRTLHIRHGGGKNAAKEIVRVLHSRGLNAFWDGNTARTIQVDPD